jgi:hypothetical protein
MRLNRQGKGSVLKSPISIFQKPTQWSLLLLCWSFLVFLIYFSIHSIFDFSFLLELAQDTGKADLSKFLMNFTQWIKAIALCGLVALILWRSGRVFWNWLGLTFVSSTLRYCFETALGILFLNGLWLGLGLNGLWFKPLVLFLGVILSIWALWDFWREGFRWRPLFSLKLPQGSFLLITLLVLAFVGLNIAQTLLPETYFDALVYHLSTLQYWGFHHGIVDMPGNFFTHYPFGAELYFWNGFFLGGSQAAKLLNVGILILTSLVAGAWVAEEGSLAAGALATASVLFLPLLSTTTWALQNDIYVTFFFLIFVYALMKWPSEKNNPWFTAVGLMGGAVLSAKYTALLGLGAAFTLWVFLVSRAWLRNHLNQWMIMKALLLLWLVPWALKNYVFTGNLLYPYFAHWLGGQTLPPENLMSLMLADETPWVMNPSLKEWIVQVFTHDLDKTIAPLLLAFVPFFFTRGSWKESVRYLLFTSFFYLLLGFLVSYQLRLVIPAVVLLIVAMGKILNSTDPKKIRSWSWVVLTFGLMSFVSLSRVGISYYHLGEMWTGFKNEKEYLETTPQTRSYFSLTEAAQILTPSSDRLLIVGDSRSLYFSKDFCANSIFDRQLLVALAHTEKDSTGIRHRLKELGIDDLVVSGEEGQRLSVQNGSYYPLSESDWGKLDDLVRFWTDPRFIAGSQGLYRLRETPLARQKPIPDLLLLLKTPKLNS